MEQELLAFFDTSEVAFCSSRRLGMYLVLKAIDK